MVKWLFFVVWVFYESSGVYVYHSEHNTRSDALARIKLVRQFTSHVFIDSVRTASETGRGCADTVGKYGGRVYWKREIKVSRWTPRGDSTRKAWGY